MTISLMPLACPPRFGTPRNPDRPTLGPAIGAVARMLGTPLMPWQQYVADVTAEIDPATGRYWYREYVLTVPRQSGKSAFVLAKASHRASATKFYGPRQQIVYTAQTRKDARKKFEEDYFPPLIESAKRLGAKEHWNNGSEHFRFPNRSRFGIESTTEKSGHGGTLDEVFIDEAFAQQDGRLEQAFGPAMITRQNAQKGVISTAGWLDASPYLWAKVEAGRDRTTEGKLSRIAYFEWSAEEGSDPFDKSLWPSFMPALGFTITEEAIEAELEAAASSPEGLNGFMRPYMNLWVPKTLSTSLFPGSSWTECADPVSSIVSKPVLALSISPDRARASLAVSGKRADGLLHVEIVLDGANSDDFLAESARIAADHHARVTLVKTHPAGGAIEDLKTLGARIDEMTNAEYGQGCGALYDDVKARTLRYVSPQPELDAAIGRASRRRSGQTFQWDGDGITALVAVTQAAQVARKLSRGRGRVVLLAQ